MEHYIQILLIPLSLVLAWQDWKSSHVNIAVALVTLAALALSADHLLQIVLIFSILWIYQHFRKNSIQLIDIALFSLGAGHFTTACLPAYCLITAIALIVLFKSTHKAKLPFIVAWVAGYWGTYFLKLYTLISC